MSVPTAQPPDVPDQARWQALTHPQRLPGLSAAGLAMLRRLREHPAAPVFRDVSGHRLNRRAQWAARWRHLALRHAPLAHGQGGQRPPAWLWAWAWQQLGQVAAWPDARQLWAGWARLPTTSRADLQHDLARHVPSHRQNAQLLCFNTSGTTGHPIRVPSLPRVAADYQALHQRALQHFGIRLQAGRGEVGIVLAGFQRRCFSYVSVNPLRGECGLVKLNLHPADWRQPDDRARYLDDLRPELISGDPVSLSELAQLPMTHRPRALLSTSMALHGGLRARLQQRFGCPVLDLYSMNEVGPIGVFVDALEGFLLLQPRLYIEILDEAGQPLPPGEHGEVTVSGGFNPCLPLLRYRTGDHARLVLTPRGPVLRDLQGRPPVRLRHQAGHWVNNVDVTQALRGLDLQRFSLHQQADGALQLGLASCSPDPPGLEAQLRKRLSALLGPWPLAVQPLAETDKVRQYTSALAGADRPPAG